MERIIGKNINLRLAEVSDAEFTLNLRLNRGKLLSKTTNNLEQQKEWIAKYKKREKNGSEYYFIIENKNNFSVGVIRIYEINFENKLFAFGSFIIDENLCYKYTALEAITLVFNYAFNVLNLEKCLFDCKKINNRANRFYARYEAIPLGEDDINFYYEYNKDLFNKNCSNYLKIINDSTSSQTAYNTL